MELQWVLDVPSVLYAPDSVTLLVSPNPILQPVGAAVSPTMLTLTHDTEYTATLVLTNCAGTNTSTIEFRTGKNVYRVVLLGLQGLGPVSSRGLAWDKILSNKVFSSWIMGACFWLQPSEHYFLDRDHTHFVIIPQQY